MNSWPGSSSKWFSTNSTPPSVLLAYCRVAVGGGTSTELKRLNLSADWARLLELARGERVTPLLHRLFTRAPALSQALAEFLQAIGRDYHANAGRFLLLATGLGEILEVFRHAEIESLVLKGMALAEPVYGNPALRPMDDIDLLVRREDAPQARAALAKLEYSAPRFEHDLRSRAATVLAPPRSRSSMPAVDLHWDLVDDRYGPAASRWADRVWERSRALSIGGLSACTLSPTDALIYACVHLAVHHGLRGLLWYCDLAMMARAWREEIEWERLVRLAREARLTGMVHAALKCGEAMVGLGVPAWVCSRLCPRALRTRALTRWLVPRLVALRSISYQDYVVPLLLMDRARDVTALVVRRTIRVCGCRLPASPRSGP